MHPPRALAASVVLAASLLLVGGLAGQTRANAAPGWAPAATASIRPGVETVTEGNQCTANFVFFDGSNNVYIGQAAHCAATGLATETDGCIAQTLPEGTPVEVQGASNPGTMVYSSWVRMQARGETDANTCAYNDFALVRLNPADFGKVNPTVPHWGGPNGLAGGTGELEQVYSYGNSSLRFGLSPLSPKIGVSLGTQSSTDAIFGGTGGWSQTVYTLTPGIPGDSGSGFLNSTGQAFGVLSTLNLAPFALGNGVGSLAPELAYMRNTSPFSSVQLANGTEPFRGGLPL